MIQTTKQTWQIGQEVKVGFLKLTVHSIVSHNAAGMDRYQPDAYILVSAKGVAYQFIPHNGLTRIDN